MAAARVSPPALIKAALAADGCRGCAPALDTRLEAYVLLWAVAAPADGSADRIDITSLPRFDGLRVALASLRQQDKARKIVIMAIFPDPALSRLAVIFGNLEVRMVPQILASRVRNRKCRWNVKAMLKKHQAPQPAETDQTRNKHGRYDIRRQTSTVDGRYNLRRTLEMMQAFTKYNVWNLTDFTRVLYFDTDALMTRPVDALWNLTFESHEVAAAVPTLTKGRSGTIRSKRCADYQLPWNRKYNNGIFLARPIRAVYDAWMSALDDPTFEFSCPTDQEVFNTILARRHVRCLGHSFNCYEPRVVTGPRNASSAATETARHCGDETVRNDERVKLRMPHVALAPHILHFATNSKPWVAREAKGLSYYQLLWLEHNRSVPH